LISPGREAPLSHQAFRVQSIDALRGFVMFMMIFVNDLAGASKTVPDWMVHFSDRHRGGSGMTFVDLVFPAFLFLVGMSIPFALGRRLDKGEPVWKVFGHSVLRTSFLLLIGILMVHDTPDTAAMGWSGNWWCVIMYVSAICALCTISPPASAAESSWNFWRNLSRFLRVAGLATLSWLAFAFRGPQDQHIVTLLPFSLHTEWYGILGLIGWAYLVTSIVFLIFRGHRTAILGCMVLLMCLFAADKTGTFEGLWLGRVVGIGDMLGSLAAISAGGLILGSMLIETESNAMRVRSNFTFWFVAACAAAALLLNGSYGISKNRATPSWCLWACAITASLWYVFYLLSDVRPVRAISQPLSLAGNNVLLAYLISEMLPGLLAALGLENAYGRLAANLLSAIMRSAFCALIILLASTGLNRVGFRIKL
jgi:predicted acyltransferase